MDASLEARARRERDHQISKAVESVSDVVEALRIAYAVSDPSDNNQALEHTHAMSQDLATAIVSLR